MLKRRIFVILIFVLGFCCFENFAYSNNRATVYLESKEEIVEQGSQIEIMTHIKNEKVAACNFSIYFDTSKLEFIPNSDNTDFMGNINLLSNRINFVWFDPLAGEGARDGKIDTFKFRAKEKGLATFTIEGQFYNKNGQLIETDFKETQVQIGKEENSLQKQARRATT